MRDGCGKNRGFVWRGCLEKRGKTEVAHLEGFEPPTNRFVAEYSIQLSYRCMRLATFLRWHIIPAKKGFTSIFENQIGAFKIH